MKYNFFKIILASLFIISPFHSYSQALLNANGPGNTYELINSVFAPGGTAEETPDQFDPSFGRHIAEVWDTQLGKYVFEVYVHVSVPNELQDESTGDTDRQRCELKTYESSPANLKGVSGETVVYKWQFRLPIGFQPSPNFTHIHQVKAVNGDDGNPIFTLTPRYKSTGNQLELIYVDGRSLNNITTKLASVDLSPFIGNWVEATERINVDSLNGTYSISINRLSDGLNLLSYSGSNLCTIRSTNSFIRPKWGVYRSISSLSYLRDEAVRFNSFSISESLTTKVDTYPDDAIEFKGYSNRSLKQLNVEYYLPKKENVELNLLNINGQKVKSLITKGIIEGGQHKNQFDSSLLRDGIYFVSLQTENGRKTIKLIL